MAVPRVGVGAILAAKDYFFHNDKGALQKLRDSPTQGSARERLWAAFARGCRAPGRAPCTFAGCCGCARRWGERTMKVAFFAEQSTVKLRSIAMSISRTTVACFHADRKATILGLTYFEVVPKTNQPYLFDVPRHVVHHLHEFDLVGHRCVGAESCGSACATVHAAICSRPRARRRAQMRLAMGTARVRAAAPSRTA